MIPDIAENVEELARIHVMTRSPRTRAHLCELCMPLVRRLAGAVLRRLPNYFTDDDLIGDGCVGLLRAIDRFDPERGMSFESWAARIIRGSMLNGLRRMDTIPERVRRDARTLDRARWALAQSAGVTPSDTTAADGARLSRKKLSAVLLALRRAVPLSLDAPIPQPFDHVATLQDKLPAGNPNPSTVIAAQSLKDVVARAVRQLPERERFVIANFYAGEVNFRTIGGQLGISKQRVSQIHGHALANLRGMLPANLLDA